MNTQMIFETLAGTYCCSIDAHLTFKSSETHLTSLLGYTPEDLKSNFQNSLIELILPEFREPVLYTLMEQLPNSPAVELLFQIQHKDGHNLWVLNRSKKIVHADGTECIYGLFTDISNIKRAFDRINHDLLERAEQDPLTHLLNNSTARGQVEEYLDSFPTGPHCALLILDLDNFKRTNDQYGHMYGDAVLVNTAQEIRKLFRSGDIISRIGGDEFMILMKDVSDQILVQERCQMLIDAIHSIEHDEEHPDSVSCSVGVAFSPVHGTTYTELFKHADQALYCSKKLGKNRFSIYKSQE